MSLDSLHDLYVSELKDLYNAENQLLKALPRMAKAATAPELKAAFTEHLESPATRWSGSTRSSPNWESVRRGGSARRWRGWSGKGRS